MKFLPLLAASVALGIAAARAVDTTTVFNEVMYHPAAAGDTEWLELHNEMAVNMDLAGWKISSGVSFTFPNNTVIPAGGYLVVAANPAALPGVTALGPWTGSLNNAGETIRLLNRIDRVMDEFTFDNAGDFTVAADGGGVTLSKRASGVASGDAASWTYSGQVGGTPGADNFPSGLTLGPAVTMSAFAATWNYNQSGANLGAAWAATTYAAGTGGWLAGPGVFAFENDPVALPVGTVLADPGAVVTHYFQRSFNFTGNPSQFVLQLSSLIDDGALVSLNGTEVSRLNMPGGTVNGLTHAAASVNNATVSAPATIPGLVAGTNVVSVSVHAEPVGGSSSLALTPSSGFTLSWDGGNGRYVGGAVPGNFANAAGATAFGSSELFYGGIHTIAHINDGIYGNSNSWISNFTAPAYIGVKFAASVQFSRVAWSRDNTGSYNDRSFGTYTIQYTTVAAPGTGTAETENVATGWKTIGGVTYTAGDAAFLQAQRHEFTCTPTGGGAITATGVRIKVSDPQICMDELEVAGPVASDVVFGAQLTAREILPAPGSSALVINELAGSTDATWRIELRNTGATTLALSNYALAASNAPAGVTLSGSLAPGALLVLDQSQLGFRPLLDDRVFLYNATRSSLLDAAVVKTTVRARSGANFLTPTAATFGAANTFSLTSDIIINEVMYHFPPNPGTLTTPAKPNPEEWIELYNRGAANVSLAGWKLDGATPFTFPAGTTLAPGGYLVVAKDSAALIAKWPEQSSRIIGNFSGGLSNSGDRIALNDANGNPACEVRYLSGGAWPELPHGRGSSLELRDPRADLSTGSAWAASDQSAGSAWQNVSYTITAGQTFGQTQWNEFRFGMLDAGECLVDDVTVKNAGNVEQIQGGNFEALTSKWRMLGNHGMSAIEPEPGNPSNHVLHIRTSGAFGWNHNHLETTFVGNTALVDGQSYTVSFRARWLSGSNQLNSRAYYSRLARTTELTIPARLGTPGAVNSRAAANIGPTLGALAHSPIVPTPAQPVTVSLAASDPDGMGAVTLRYALNGSATFASVAMTASGATYTAPIPAQSAGTIVQFYVQAADPLGATSTLPAAGANSRALYLVDDGAGTALTAHELRVIMLPADSASLLATLNRVSDRRIGGTAIYKRGEAFYDVGVRLQGTAAGRVRDGEDYVGYDVGFPPDHLFRGVHDSVNIDRSGRSPVTRGQDEIYVKHMFHRAGVPCTYDDLVYFISPTGLHTGTAILQMEGYEGEFLTSQFGGNGAVFNLDGTYEPATTTDGNPESLKNPVPLAAQIDRDFGDIGTDKEQYRGFLEPRAGRRYDDFTGLIPFCQTMSLPTAQLVAQLPARMNVDEWMRCAALYSLCGLNDCYMNGGFHHNLRVWVPSDGLGVVALPWDMDFIFSYASNSPAMLTSGNLRRFMDNSPAARRAYYGHLHDLCNTVFNSTYMTPWLTHYGSVVGQGMSGQASYIDARKTSILAQLPAPTGFAITTNGGANFSVNATTATLAGTGWINVRKFRRADTGVVLDATWTSDTTWQLSVALNYGPNAITLQAYDYQDAFIATASITITSTLPAPNPRDTLRITELMYHPAAPTGAETTASTDNDDFEFIELRNLSGQSLDISGCKFTAGVNFTFAAGTTLASGEYIHVIRHLAAFRARYGNGPRVAGVYGPADSLSNSGETITLLDAPGAVIQSFTYHDTFPWPASADGLGYSLVPIAPQLPLDRNLPANWRASTTIGGNVNGSDATTFTGTHTADADKDGLIAFLEYALGTSDTSPTTATWSLVPDAGTYLFTFQRALAADDVALTIEASTDLTTWTPANATLISTTTTGNIVSQTWRITPSASALFFVRLKGIEQ